MSAISFFPIAQSSSPTGSDSDTPPAHNPPALIDPSELRLISSSDFQASVSNVQTSINLNSATPQSGAWLQRRVRTSYDDDQILGDNYIEEEVGGGSNDMYEEELAYSQLPTPSPPTSHSRDESLASMVSQNTSLNSTYNTTSTVSTQPSNAALIKKLKLATLIISQLKKEIKTLKNPSTSDLQRSSVHISPPPPVGINEKLKMENTLLKIQLTTKTRENTVLERRCDRLKDELRELTGINEGLRRFDFKMEGRRGKGGRRRNNKEEDGQEKVEVVVREDTTQSTQSTQSTESTESTRPQTSPTTTPKLSQPQPKSSQSTQTLQPPNTQPTSTFPGGRWPTNPQIPNFNLTSANVRLRMSWPSNNKNDGEGKGLGNGFGEVDDVMESWEIKEGEGSLDFSKDDF